MKKTNYKNTIISKKLRLKLSALFLTFIFILLIIRLFYLMILQHSYLSQKATDQCTNEINIKARRGNILDRNDLKLAVSANVYRVDLDLKTLREDSLKKKISLESIAENLSKILNYSKEDVMKKINFTYSNGKLANSITLVRRIEKEVAIKIKNLNQRSIIVSEDTKRYYINNNLLSHTLGVTDVDGDGLSGIELKYNKELSGIPGIRIKNVDRENKDLPYKSSTFSPSINGKDINLTIDERFQTIADNAASKALIDNKAKSATILIMEPKSGEILALANKPDFNPNCPYEGYEKFQGKDKFNKIQNMWKNNAVNSSFEPGSIFKVITSAAAIEEGISGNNETYYCPGYKKYKGACSPVKCWKADGHGTETFAQTLEKSCNVAFMDIATKLGKDTLDGYIRKFGFGKLTNIDLPGETLGILKNIKDMSDMDLGTISFGQTNTLNAIQYMAAFNAIANDGVWIQPHIMKEISYIDENNKKIIDTPFKPSTHNVISPNTSKKLREYLEKVVSEGSAKSTFIPNFHIGGKTGTGEKVCNGRYKDGKYVSTFAGMAPCNSPKITILVIINEPSAGEHFGGIIATPIAKDIFLNLSNYINFNN